MSLKPPANPNSPLGTGRVFFNVQSDYGAYGDGSTDDTTAIQNAVTACNAAGGGTVWFPEGSYKITSAITVASNVVLRGAGHSSIIDFSAQTGTFTAISATGMLGTGVALTANATEGTSVLTMASTTGFAVGDWVKIDTTAQWGETSLQGEFNQIRALDATTLTLYQPLADTYNTANTAKVYLASFVENIALRDLQLLGPTDTSLSIQGFVPTLVRNLVVENCRFRRTNYIGINLTDCVDFHVRGCELRDIFKSGTAYGVEVAWCCQDGSIIGCHGENMRHFVTMGGGLSRSGVTRRVSVAGNTARTIDAAVDTHGGAEDITISGNGFITSIDDTSAGVSDHDGIIVQGTRATIANNVVRSISSSGATVGVGIRYQQSSGKPGACAITGNKTYGYKYGVDIDFTSGYTTWSGVTISGNTIESPGLSGIYINGTVAAANPIKNVSITGNTIKSAGDRGILVLNAIGVAISNNVIESPTAEGMYIYNNSTGTLTDVTVTGNVLKNGSSEGIYIRSATGATVSGNSIEVPASKHGIYFLTTVHGTISGNRILGLSTTGSVGIRLGTTATNIAITGNEVTGLSIGIYFSSTDCINNTVTGNVAQGNTTAFNLSTGSPNLVADNTPGVIASVASAATIAIPGSENDIVTISGTADITAITALPAGRVVKLMFSGTAATSGIVDNGTTLNLASTLAYTPNDTLTLYSDGTNWRELGRSVN